MSEMCFKKFLVKRELALNIPNGLKKNGCLKWLKKRLLKMSNLKIHCTKGKGFFRYKSASSESSIQN